MDTPPELSWETFAAFVRQHSHDVRNHLNGIDLEAALLNDLVDNDEAKASVGRLRHQIRSLAAEFRGLSAKLSENRITKEPVSARELFLIWKEQAAALNPPPRIKWSESVGGASVNLDIEAIARALRELLLNAVAFGTGAPLRADAETSDGHVAYSLTEPKDAPVDFAGWGRTPLLSTRRGAYGLGLWEMDRNVGGSGGQVQRRYDPEAKTLTTTLVFPAL